MATEKEREARARLKEQWADFIGQKQGILQRRSHGRTLSEDDVEQMFGLLFQGPLGYDIWQIGRQQDYADRTLEGQGIKLAVVEIKRYRAFERVDELDSALIQAARYADRHRTPNLIAFDGDNPSTGSGHRLVLALRRKLMDDVPARWAPSCCGKNSAWRKDRRPISSTSPTLACSGAPGKSSAPFPTMQKKMKSFTRPTTANRCTIVVLPTLAT